MDKVLFREDIEEEILRSMLFVALMPVPVETLVIADTDTELLPEIVLDINALIPILLDKTNEQD